MHLNLHYFASFFEAMGVLHFAYAGSETFRTGLTDDLLDINKPISAIKIEKARENYKQKIESKADEVMIISTENYGASYGKAQQFVDQSKRIYEKDKDGFTTFEKEIAERKINDKKFVEGFKSMFFLTGLYCMFLLLMEGYGQFYEERDPFLISKCLIIFNLVFLINVALLYRSITIAFNTAIKSLYIVMTTICLVILSIFLYHFYFITWVDTYLGQRLIVTWSVIIAASPFIFHVLRVWVHKAWYRYIGFYYWNLRLYCSHIITCNALNEVRKTQEVFQSIFEGKPNHIINMKEAIRLIWIRIIYFLHYLLCLKGSSIKLKFNCPMPAPIIEAP